MAWRAAARSHAAVGQQLRGAALAGAILFMASDLALALREFHPAFLVRPDGAGVDGAATPRTGG
jgi:hypothetical protein